MRATITKPLAVATALAVHTATVVHRMKRNYQRDNTLHTSTVAAIDDTRLRLSSP
jgi:hypothetical protein